jgi:hypothetical protein
MFRNLCLASVTLSVLMATSHAKADFVLGGFDASRGGVCSVNEGTLLNNLRAAIAAAFPDVTLSGNATLTEDCLSSIDFLLIGAPRTEYSQVNPLCPKEQDAMVGFINAGGRALIFTDNRDFEEADQSFLQPFGMHEASILGGSQQASVLDPSSHPITDGPFGTIFHFHTYYPGYFDDLGPSTLLATLDADGEPVLAVIDPGVLSDSSGGVVFFGDTSMIIDSELTQDNANLVLNALAFLIGQ